MQVLVNKLMTTYDRRGKGKTVVCLHGWGDSRQTFAALATTLSDAYDVIVLDLPGFGKTDRPKTAWDLHDYAEFVRDFLKKIGVKKTYAIVGHSNGGGIAIRGLANGDLSAEKLVLLASAGIRGEYRGRGKLLRLMTKTGKVLTKPLPKNAKKRLRKAVYESIGSDMLVAEHMQETFKKIVADDVQDDAPKLKLPVLLVYGENDTATPPRYGDRFQALIPKAKLEILHDTGHFVHHEQPDKVASLTVEFLR